MEPLQWQYQLKSSRETATTEILEFHHVNTFAEAVWMLLAHTVAEVDHQRMANAAGRQQIAAILEKGTRDVVLELWSEPLAVDGEKTSRPGLYIMTPTGTIYDFEHMVGQDLYHFKEYGPNKNVLYLCEYEQASRLSVKMDPTCILFEKDLAANIADEGKYQLSFIEENKAEVASKSRRHEESFYFSTALAAFGALFTNQYVIARLIGPQLHGDAYCQTKISDPNDKVIMQTRVVTPSDEDSRDWSQPGLFLTFPDGLAHTSNGYNLLAPIPKDHQVEDDCIVMADFSRNYKELMVSPVAEVIRQQLLARKMVEEAITETGYYVTLSMLPTHIPRERASEDNLKVVYQAAPNFNVGLHLLKNFSQTSMEPADAPKNLRGHYLVEAVLYEKGNELARLFYHDGEGGPMPAGKYLKINPDHLSKETLASLGSIVTAEQHKSDFHFLLTQPGTAQEAIRRPVLNPRYRFDGDPPHRGL